MFRLSYFAVAFTALLTFSSGALAQERPLAPWYSDAYQYRAPTALRGEMRISPLPFTFSEQREFERQSLPY